MTGIVPAMRWIGKLAADPTGDIRDGDMYWNTTANRLKIYNYATTEWISEY